MQLQNYIIEVIKLTKIYGNLKVLDKINFNIKREEIFVIVGGSGSGKSTILRQLIGIEMPSLGQVSIAGKSWQEDADILSQKIGVLFQSGGLYASMTLAENIAIALQKNTNLSEKAISYIIDMKLSAVGLDGFRNYLPSEISGGMKKRAALARAMALDPEILFFDEPSSGLDPVTSAEMDQLIKDLNKSLGTTMVIISHDLASILDIADRIIMLDKSTRSIIAEGTPKQMQNHGNPIVSKFFNREL